VAFANGCRQIDLHPRVHVREGPVRGVGAGGEQQQADQQPGCPAGGDVEHHQEDPKEQQRGAQVPLDDEHAQTGQPGGHYWAEVAAPGQVQPADPPGRQREQVPLVHQVTGEEDHQQQFGDLTGLDRESGHPDPQLRSVHLREPGRQHRRQVKQHQAHQRAGVGVALQRSMVPNRRQHGGAQHQAQRGPDQLQRRVGPGGGPVQLLGTPGRGQIQPVDQHQADAVEQYGQRQQQWVRGWCVVPHQQMRGDEQGRQGGGVDRGLCRQRAAHAGEYRHVGQGGHHQREDQHPQLRPPPARGHRHPRPAARGHRHRRRLRGVHGAQLAWSAVAPRRSATGVGSAGPR
jgi:hypothetical protein